MSVRNLRIDVRKRELLHLPQLDLRSSEIHGIIGESGSGKSLFLFSLMGLLSRGLYASGEAIFETSGSAQNLLECPEQRFRQIRGKQIGMVFQEPMSALNPRVKCGPQIEEVLQVHKVGLANAGSTVLEALEQSGLEEPLRIYHSYPHQISGGQRQRVMVAMATILKPALVLADEPTTALDPETGNAVLKTLVDRCRENRSSLILVSHDLKSIATWADSISVLRNGKCLAQGETEHVLQSGVVPYVQELLDASKVERHKTALQEPKTFVVNGLSKTYRAKGKELPVLKTVNVALAAGETLAIVGKSGSGKSTLAKILTGLEKADAGSVSFHGENILLRKNTGVQMVFQDPYSSLNNEMTCGGAVMEVLHLRGFNKTESESQARELFGLVGLSADQLSYYPHQLSGGQRQRVCIARALAAEPEVLILDESVAALDPIVQKQVLLLLADIQDNKKLIYLFITHNPEVAAYFAHSVVKIEAGVATQTQNSV